VTADAAPAWAVGVRFRPGAAVVVLDVSARELRDDRVDAADVWGRSGQILGERLAMSCDPVSATAILALELVSRLVSVASPDARVMQTFYGMRESVVVDPGGTIIIFAEKTG
jgi:hypothetical protein